MSVSGLMSIYPRRGICIEGVFFFGFCGLAGSYWLVNAAHAHTDTSVGVECTSGIRNLTCTWLPRLAKFPGSQAGVDHTRAWSLERNL